MTQRHKMVRVVAIYGIRRFYEFFRVYVVWFRHSQTDNYYLSSLSFLDFQLLSIFTVCLLNALLIFHK